MMPTFAITPTGGLVSAFANEHALHIGDRLTVTRPLDLGYMSQIAEGEQGTVVDVEPSHGGVEIRMDALHRGLHAWHNCLLVVPFMSEDTIDAFCLIVA